MEPDTSSFVCQFLSEGCHLDPADYDIPAAATALAQVNPDPMAMDPWDLATIIWSHQRTT